MSANYSKVDELGRVFIPQELLKPLGWEAGREIAVSSKGKSIALKQSTGQEEHVELLDEFGRIVLPMELRKTFQFNENDLVVLERKPTSIAITALPLEADRTVLLHQKIDAELEKISSNKLAEDFAEVIKMATFNDSDIDDMLAKPDLLEELYGFCVGSKGYDDLMSVTLWKFLASKNIQPVQSDEIQAILI